VAEQAEEMSRAAERLASADPQAAEAAFEAEHSARSVRAAEAYYSAGSQGHAAAWNLRDTHMADTLDAVRRHLEGQRGRPARIVVWAHNSHVGDARALSSTGEAELSLGQLVRMRAAKPGDTVLIGLTTHAGTVTAASDWGSAPATMPLRPSLPGSIERLSHESGVPAFLLPLRSRPSLRQALAAPLPQRAVGAVYRPDTEQASHYIAAILPDQYDAIVHIDRTQALEPLD
jgi:erythromycin esterase-like protein